MLAAILPPHTVQTLVREWLAEDAPTFDIGGLVVGDAPVEAHLLYKGGPRTAGGGAVGGAVLAGVPFFGAVFESLGCTVEWAVEEGAVLAAPRSVAVVRGAARCVLLGERTALNILARASGVATGARAFAGVAAAAGWVGEVAGSRKVTPGGFRLVEKYALLVGGVATHRLDLSQMVMLKDNHVWAAGSIAGAVGAAKRAGGFSTKVEVEARGLEEAMEAAGAGADVVMLDNYTDPADLHRDAAALKARFPAVLVEASGGITLDTVRGYMGPHVDVVSVGSLTQGYAVADFSLKVSMGKGVERIKAVVEAGGKQ